MADLRERTPTTRYYTCTPGARAHHWVYTPARYYTCMPRARAHHWVYTPARLALLAASLVAAAGATSTAAGVAGAAEAEARPYLLPLRREAVPVVRKGRTVSQRSAYYGVVALGGPVPQEFSVVFDTGSGHVVIPSVECKSATCMEHRRYNISKSPSAMAINSDGKPVPPDELCDQVTIGFGTGTVRGEFAREEVCVGQGGPTSKGDGRTPCATMTVVMGVEMSEQPFRSFAFDGLFGLGLGGLALAPDFSFFGRLAAGARSLQPRFGIFLTNSEDGEGSEIAIGGHNDARTSGPLTWVPVAQPKLGYWQVRVRAIRIGGVEFGGCHGGSCRAVLDTGTSHLGVPGQHIAGLTELLSAASPLGARANCRSAAAPALSIVLDNFTLTLDPKDYMRPEPLNASVPRAAVALASHKPSSGKPGLPAPAAAAGGGGGRSVCRPRLTPVSLKAPLGPNLFILGEPLLQRYYTVYDWKAPRIGFAAARGRGLPAGRPEALGVAVQPDVDEEAPEQETPVFLMQVTLSLVYGA